MPVANPFDLSGKVVLVTGANSGLGLAWAEAAAAAGADVVIWGRRPETNREAATQLKAYRNRVLHQTVDVSEEAQVVEATAAAIERLGRLDGVIANAGINRPTPFAELDSERWREVLEINLNGAYYTFREAVRHMLARADAGDPGGSLIACGSLSVDQGVPAIGHYAAAKGGLAALTRSLAVEHGARGIRANMVLPGRIATNLGGTSPAEKAGEEHRTMVIPIPRYGTPADCAGIVVYLLSDAAAYHTGDLITIDGGLSIRLPG